MKLDNEKVCKLNKKIKELEREAEQREKEIQDLKDKAEVDKQLMSTTQGLQSTLKIINNGFLNNSQAQDQKPILAEYLTKINLLTEQVD